ncbi:MAG: nitroreductase [Gammaproteobacteria bacterium]|nr:nitroreductase [Gammaproteobacteria bacterium]
MDVTTAIKDRKSVRAFLDKPVSKEILHAMLDTARWSASGVNTQPWTVEVVTGQTQQCITDTILDLRARAVAEDPDYSYYPEQWREPYKSRRKATGLALYGALGIGKGETERMVEAKNNNYRFFGAPAAMFLFMDRDMGTGTWIDMGIFLQSLMLAAREHGLESCPQASLAEYPNTVREILKVPEDKLLVCGLSLGYADPDAPVNGYRTEREDVDTFTRWHD